jgi:hypothetical protein
MQQLFGCGCDGLKFALFALLFSRSDSSLTVLEEYEATPVDPANGGQSVSREWRAVSIEKRRGIADFMKGS